MSTASGLLLVGWLVAALVVLGMDGRLPEFLAAAVPGSLLLLRVGALVRQQLAPLPATTGSPSRYRPSRRATGSLRTCASRWPPW
jgi:hypothetical protein